MKRAIILSLLLLLGPAGSGVAAEEGIVKLSHPPPSGVTRADLYLRRTAEDHQGWLLLCPGQNGNGENLIKEKKWFDFARHHRLLMAGVSYAAEKSGGSGPYTEVHKGSGGQILAAMDAFAGKELPMLLAGFSAGARFTASWANWRPDRVLAWSAQAVALWPEPSAMADGPPGIVASGEYDAGCWFASLQYFQAARRQGRRVVWLSLEKLGHARAPALDDFTRSFFETILEKKAGGQPLWRDIDSKKSLSAEAAAADPQFASWFPSAEIQDQWLALHKP